jgi:hypothetical protein
MTRLTPAVASKLVEAVALGADRVQACAYAEVPYLEFRGWERKASLGDHLCTKLIRDLERAEVGAIADKLRAQLEPPSAPAECPTCKAIMAELSREILACRDRIAMETLAEVWSRLAQAHGALARPVHTV